MTSMLLLLAQAASQPEGEPPAQPSSFFQPQFFGLLLAMGVLWYMILRGQRRERRKQSDMLRSLKRNDRVQTIGGILGTISEVRGNEVILKVDESSNVKIRFHIGAIKEVLADDSSEKPGDKR